jgi:hypothetical protein
MRAKSAEHGDPQGDQRLVSLWKNAKRPLLVPPCAAGTIVAIGGANVRFILRFEMSQCD